MIKPLPEGCKVLGNETQTHYEVGKPISVIMGKAIFQLGGTGVLIKIGETYYDILNNKSFSSIEEVHYCFLDKEQAEMFAQSKELKDYSLVEVEVIPQLKHSLWYRYEEVE